VVFNPRRGRTVLVEEGDTGGWAWEYDGAQWTRLPAISPIILDAASMTYDTQSHQVLMFGVQSYGDPESAVYRFRWETPSPP
jgi:hypothetical protein